MIDTIVNPTSPSPLRDIECQLDKAERSEGAATQTEQQTFGEYDLVTVHRRVEMMEIRKVDDHVWDVVWVERRSRTQHRHVAPCFVDVEISEDEEPYLVDINGYEHTFLVNKKTGKHTGCITQCGVCGCDDPERPCLQYSSKQYEE